MLDCVDVGFLPDGILDQLPLPCQVGATKVGGVDRNKARLRATLHAVLALCAAPGEFTVADLAPKVNASTADSAYTVRQAAYDLRKLRGKGLVDKPGKSRRYHVPAQSARTLAALLVLRDHVIGPDPGRRPQPTPRTQPAHWTAIDRDYGTLRTGMQTLFGHLGINTA